MCEKKKYVCLECGAEFDELKMIREDHGEEFGHCPNCLGLTWTDSENLECEVCGSITRGIEQIFCEDCKATIKRVMGEAVTKIAHEFDFTFETATKEIREVVNGRRIEDAYEARIGTIITNELIDFAMIRNASIAESFDIADAWVNESAYLKRG